MLDTCKLREYHEIMNVKKYPCIIPTTLKDYLRLRNLRGCLFDLLPINELVFIGADDLLPYLNEDSDTVFSGKTIGYIDENILLPRNDVLSAFNRHLSSQSGEPRPSMGAYYQQFLKMAYSLACESDYYISWDADTLPVHKIEMFDSFGTPYFDVKPEHQADYFETINKLFGYSKAIYKSFISEHMIFNTSFMIELIRDISGSKLSGSTFYDKIFSAIGTVTMRLGFSEFETYGTYVAHNHPSAYRIREWKSFRNLGFFLSPDELTGEDIDWLSTDFDAITFESYHKRDEEFNQVFKNPENRQRLSAGQFYLSILEGGYLGEYKDGIIKIDNDYFAI